MKFGRLHHEPDKDIPFFLKGAFVAHELLKHPKQKWSELYQELTKDLNFDEDKLKAYVKDVIKKQLRSIE